MYILYPRKAVYNTMQEKTDQVKLSVPMATSKTERANIPPSQVEYANIPPSKT